MLRFAYLCFLCLQALNVVGQLKINGLYANNAVLQQKVPIPIWGKAEEGENITVSFAGHVRSAVTRNGKWMVEIPPVDGGFTSYELTVTGSKQKLVLHDILVGEVWLCSGQSNMAFPMRAIKPLPGFQRLDSLVDEAAGHASIRQFTIPLKKSEDIPAIRDEIVGSWLKAGKNSLGQFSAVGYFFARELYKTLNVPVGIVHSSYGGTAIENWMSRDTLDKMDAAKDIFSNYQKQLKQFPAALSKYRAEEAQLMSLFTNDSLAAVASGGPLPRKPAPPMSPAERGGPTGLWNTMINPLIPFPVKGCVWYQGEANASRGIQYRDLLPAMIGSWRTAWRQEFPFIIIQLPGWKNHAPELREAQWMATQKMPATSIVTITDCDDTLDVHPGNKEPVGFRAALQARALVYKESKLVYSGPEWSGLKRRGDKLILHFNHVGGGLVVKGDRLQDFEVAGADGKFFKAQGVISGKNKVVLTSDQVPVPLNARLGWRFSPQINLFNREGLCAIPFRTNIQ